MNLSGRKRFYEGNCEMSESIERNESWFLKAEPKEEMKRKVAKLGEKNILLSWRRRLVNHLEFARGTLGDTESGMLRTQ
jgi:hypothetical protein